MQIKIFLFLLLFVTKSFAVEPLPSNLINFTSPKGLILLQKNINGNALKLLEHFTTQKTVSYCGIASTVMILNSSNLTPPTDNLHSGYSYFNQENFFNEQIKLIITHEKVQMNGIKLLTLSQIIQSFGLKSELFYANDLNIEEFRTLLINSIINQQFMIVNFLRTELGQQGGGHHSPVAAYDDKTDRVLLLDVARYKYPAYWVTIQDLWKAINTKDNEISRGFLIITN